MSINSDNFEVTIDSDSKATPRKYEFLKSLDLDIDVQKRLAIHLDGVVSGNDTVLLTPMAKEYDPKLILAEWDKIFQQNSSKINDTLDLLEQSNRSKFGPRSIAKPWKDRKEGVLDYFTNKKSTIHTQSLFPIDKLGKGNLRPLDYSKALKYIKNDTNSGLPYYTRKGRVKDRVVSKIDKLLRRMDPCIMFTRTQESGKTRTVWGYPIAVTLLEMCYYRPLLELQRRLTWRAAIVGPKEVDRQVTKIIDKALSSGGKLISIDFSAYDASVGTSLIEAAFNYIKSLFQKRYHDMINYIEDLFSGIGLITPDGIIKSRHGVPSGSTFTNEVDSIVQYLIAKYSNVTDENYFLIQGDDGIYLVADESSVKTLFKAFSDAGLNVNIDKSYTSNDYVIFLQNLHHNDYRDSNGLIGGIYPTYRALNRILYQERWSNFEEFGLSGKDYYSIRTISILENVKYHPLFKEFVEFILKFDKYSLEVSKEGIASYVRMMEQGPGTGDFLNNQYGDDVKGIKSFESYKIIKSIIRK